MAVLTEPAAEPVVASAPMPAPDAIEARVSPVSPSPQALPRTRGGTAAPPPPRRTRTKRRTGRRLFQFDRGLGVRWVAGADEAGRGCLAGPLVAAAVLFDVEALGVRERPGADRAQRLQAARPRGARGALPGRHAHRRQGRRRLALRARHRRLRAAQDEPRRPARRARRVARPGVPVPHRRLRRARLRLRAAPDRRRRRHERRDRRRLDRGQGHPRPLHAPRRRAASRAGSSAPTSATRRPSTATPIQRQGVSPLHRLSFQSTAYQQLRSEYRGAHQNAASRWSRRTSLPRASMTTPIASKRSSGESRAVGDLEQEGRGHPADLVGACARAGPPTGRVRSRSPPRLDLDEDERASRRRRRGRARRSACGGCARRARSRGARGGRGRGPRRCGRGVDAGRWTRRRR